MGQVVDTAYLITHVKTNNLGVRESTNYEWSGNSPYLYVDIRFIADLYPNKLPMNSWDDIKEIQIGPYKLLQVDTSSMWNLLYVRKDKFGQLRVWLYKSTRMFDLIYRRMIITLAVWNLAEYSQACIPTWKDIKLFRKKK